MNTVAILMPSLNMNDFFVRAYETVLAQTDTDWVVYAMDAIGEEMEEDVVHTGGHHQNLFPLVEQLNKKYGKRIVCYKQKKQGILGQALNELYEYAVQDGYVNFAFLAADDGWYPRKLEMQKIAYNKNKDKHPFLLTTKVQRRFGALDLVDNYELIKLLHRAWESVYSSVYFTKDFIDKKKIASKGKFTSYDSPWCLDWEFYAETQMAGLEIFRLNMVLTFYDFCNPKTNSLGCKIHQYPHIREKEKIDRNLVIEKFDLWETNANNR